jgi:hypothetical protein
MRIDDRLHSHRKTRSLLRNSPSAVRSAAPMGLWVLAGSWASQNRTNGWIPADELERFDDDWDGQAKRLVRAGYWWPEERDGESGYGFVNWETWNPSSEKLSDDGKLGNHVRWHVNRGIVEPACEHCPIEPEWPGDIAGESGGDIGGRSPRDIGGDSPFIAEPNPDPNPEPNPKPPRASTQVDGTSSTDPARFDEFWTVYDHKIGRAKAISAYRRALKKPGVTADVLVDAAGRYIDNLKAAAKHPQFTKHPTTWLNGEHWNDETTSASEQAATTSTIPWSHELELPPDGLSPEDYARWEYEKRMERRQARGL